MCDILKLIILLDSSRMFRLGVFIAVFFNSAKFKNQECAHKKYPSRLLPKPHLRVHAHDSGQYGQDANGVPRNWQVSPPIESGGDRDDLDQTEKRMMTQMVTQTVNHCVHVRHDKL